MASTATQTIFSPVSGTEYVASSGLWVIPDNATNVTVQVSTFNSGNSPITVTQLKAIIRNVTSSSDANTQTGNNVNSAQRTSAIASNGSNIVTVAVIVTGICDHVVVQVTSYTGRVYSQIQTRRSSAWNTGLQTKVRRSGSWNSVATYVRRSGTWVQVG